MNSATVNRSPFSNRMGSGGIEGILLFRFEGLSINVAMSGESKPHSTTCKDGRASKLGAEFPMAWQQIPCSADGEIKSEI